MAGQSAKEGYLLIDNRCAGLGMQESATYTCSHCQAMVYKHVDRTRARGYCKKCDSVLCDACEAARAITGVCRPYKQFIDELHEIEVRKHG